MFLVNPMRIRLLWIHMNERNDARNVKRLDLTLIFPPCCAKPCSESQDIPSPHYKSRDACNEKIQAA